MIKTFKYLGLAVLLMAFVGISTAFAAAKSEKNERNILVHQDKEYVEVNYRDIIDTTLLVGALSLNEQPVLDEYAQLFYCKIYQDFFQNDSEWMDISGALRKKYTDTKSSVPMHYFFKTSMLVDRYNAEKKLFPLAAKSTFKNISFIDFYQNKRVRTCGIDSTKYFPQFYSLQINTPLTLESIPITSDEMLKKVSELPIWGGVNKKVTGVFFFTVQGYKDFYLSNLMSQIVLSGSLEKVSFYADDGLRNHITSIEYKPPAPMKQYVVPDFATQVKPKK